MPRFMIKTDSFRLCIRMQVFETDIRYPVNTVLTVSVDSRGFTAESQMDIDIKGFAAFSEQLAAMYATLSGTADIQEPFGYKRYISFTAERTGHITVKGFLCDDTGSNELRFANRFDQTYLKAFSDELCSACSSHKKSK